MNNDKNIAEDVANGKSPQPIGGTKPNQEQIEIAFGEAKGVYLVHPMASMFPLLEGKAYEDFKNSIRMRGQVEPIVFHHGLLLDGRNRLRVLNELGRPPWIVEFSDLNAGQNHDTWLMAKNLRRRHLTEDQRLMINAQYSLLRPKTLGRSPTKSAISPERELAQPPADGAKLDMAPTEVIVPFLASELPQVSADIADKRSRGRPRGMRSAAEALAVQSNTSRYRAEKGMKLLAQSPELALAVKEGRLSLKNAIRQLEKQSLLKKAPQHRSPDVETGMRAASKAERLLEDHALQLRIMERTHFWGSIASFASKQAKITKDEMGGNK